MISQIVKTPQPRWTQLTGRRLLNIGGVPHQKGMLSEEIPTYLQNYLDKVNELKIFEDKLANHILLNEYKPGQGILPHLDGPLFYPTISTLSVGSHTVLEFSQSTDKDEMENLTAPVPVFKLLLEPRSLLILKNSLYSSYMHSISEILVDNLDDKLLKNLSKCHYDVNVPNNLKTRTMRYSLTIRHVPKATTKLKLKFGK